MKQLICDICKSEINDVTDAFYVGDYGTFLGSITKSTDSLDICSRECLLEHMEKEAKSAKKEAIKK